MKIRISGVAKGQWKQLVKELPKTPKELEYKIRRAFDLGKTVHWYINNETLKSYIVRYYDLNLLVTNNLIMTIWRDQSNPNHVVSNKEKRAYDIAKGYINNIILLRR